MFKTILNLSVAGVTYLIQAHKDKDQHMDVVGKRFNVQ